MLKDFKIGDKFQHKIWGIGELKSIPMEGYYIISFPNVGDKQISFRAIENNLVEKIEKRTNEGNNFLDVNYKVYDGQSIYDRFQCDESSVIIGNDISCTSILAFYDLNIVGSITADSLDIGGDLIVSGNLECNSLVCRGKVICGGKISANKLDVSDGVFAESIVIQEIHSSHCIICDKSIDCNFIDATDYVFAGEGIVGEGTISATSTVALEYYDFDGNNMGELVDVDSGVKEASHYDSSRIDSLVQVVDDKFRQNIGQIDQKNSEQLVENILGLTEYSICNISDWCDLIYKLLDIKRCGEITSFNDYICIEYATRIFPESILNMADIEYVIQSIFNNVENRGIDLPVKVNEMDDLYFLNKFCNDYPSDQVFTKELFLRKIIESIDKK